MPTDLSLLSKPNLFDIITERELDKKIVGELNARKTVFLVAEGRLVKNASMTSYNLMANASSGTGKDWVVKYVLDLFQKDICFYQNKMTPAAFTYWHKSNKDWNWDGKICYLEDASNTLLLSDVFKTMSSSGTKAVVVNKKRETEEINIKGKPVLIITTNNVLPSDDMYRRFPILYMDESINQTKAIIKRQGTLAKSGIYPEYDPKVKEALRWLTRVDVKIPFADQVSKQFPTHSIIMRTHHPRFLDYIKASAAVHQYQREKEGEIIIATKRDFEIAKNALINTMQNPWMIPLTRKQTTLLNVFKENEWYSAKELLPRISWSQAVLYKMLDSLTDFGFLVRKLENVEYSDKDVCFYRKVNIRIDDIKSMCI